MGNDGSSSGFLSIDEMMPEFLRVLPAPYLNPGPDLSSSHKMHLRREPSGRLSVCCCLIRKVYESVHEILCRLTEIERKR